MPIRLRRAAARAVIIVALLATPLARAQTTFTFDLPPQSMADSLRDVARATHSNIVFDAQVVADIRAPALRGVATAEQAVAELLANTPLRYVRVDANTLRIARRDAAGRKNGADRRGSLPTAAPNGAPTDAPLGAADSVQRVPQAPAQPGASDAASLVELSEVVVTGSHIHGASTPSPTITITREDIERSGYQDVGDVIRSLPQNFSAGNNPQVEPANTPTQGNGNVSGGSSPNLRGLGPTSTLTLINGHRLGQDGTLGAVDISMIPLAAVERVEVVTDSSSAAYGSDAVAGVVNFILRRNYEGAETIGSLGTATEGGGYDRDINQLVGHTWNSGGAVLVYEHERQDAVWSQQREFTSTAASPTSLLPQSARDSGYLSAHQDIGSALSVFAEGLYTSRESDSDYTYPPALDAGSLPSRARVRQYLADFGMTAAVAHDWKATTFASVAAQRSQVTDYQIAPGSRAETVYLEELYRGSTRVAELSADGPIWALNTDSIRAAFGGGYREESLDGVGAFPLRARRGIRYAYAELNAPLAATGLLSGLRTLDLNVSGRYEGYTDNGGKVVPKIGILFSPAPPIEFRATWSKAYRAPTLDSLDDKSYVDVLVLHDPSSPTGSSPDLVRLGSNPQLRPETATTWTTTVDWNLPWVERAKVELSYFDIRYRDRVLSLGNYGTALTDPAYAPLVTRDPSEALQQAVIGAATRFNNFSGQPYVPGRIAAIVDARSLNIAEQHPSGVDLLATYRHMSRFGDLDTFVNGSYLQLRQRVTPDSPEQELVGRTFNPPRFRARGGITWSAGGWTATGILNWIGGSINTYLPGTPPVASWTSVDAQLSYTAPLGGLLAGLRASLAVQNLFDRAPPFAQYLGNPIAVGFNYDSNNFSPMGRFVSLRLSKSWFPPETSE